MQGKGAKAERKNTRVVEEDTCKKKKQEGERKGVRVWGLSEGSFFDASEGCY